MPKDEQKKPLTSNRHLVASSLISGLVLTPSRRFLNNAADSTSILEAFKKTWGQGTKGSLTNVGRTTGALCSQMLGIKFAKEWVPDCKIAELLAASFAPLFILNTLETRLIQKPATDKTCMVMNRYLFMSYALRELFFSYMVFDDKPLAYPKKFTIEEATSFYLDLGGVFSKYFACAAISGGIHRLIVSEALAPVIDPSKTGTMPHLSKDGVFGTAHHLANGHYTNPGFRPYYSNPSTAWQKFGNLGLFFLSPTVLVARVSYMVLASATIKWSLNVSEKGEALYRRSLLTFKPVVKKDNRDKNNTPNLLPWTASSFKK